MTRSLLFLFGFFFIKQCTSHQHNAQKDARKILREVGTPINEKKTGEDAEASDDDNEVFDGFRHGVGEFIG
jgi:hypothetical protein